jgi:hypothetical protein
MGVNKPLETPTDLQMKDDMARVRVEQGKQIVSELSRPSEKKEYGEPYIFRLRQFHNTQFRGLWELCMVDAKGNVREVITDADALTNALESIGNVLENRGF